MTASNAPTPATSWNIDAAHTGAEFKVKHMMITNVTGHFSGVSGIITLDEANIGNSSVEATIDATSVNTRQPDRDAHLKSADFFDVEKYPTLTFVSTSVARKGDEELEVGGNLTIHGVTHHVVFDVEGPTGPSVDPWGNTRIGLSAKTKINRKDYGLTWNSALETGGVLVGDQVTITLEIQAIKG